MRKYHTAPFILLLIVLASFWACDGRQSGEQIRPRADYRQAVAKLQDFIEYQIRDKNLPALSIALVDDQDIVWARGFGYADTQQRKPASAATVYRVGSVSKLFTDVAIMQLVEKQKLDLDADIRNFLPEFAPENSFDVRITLRQLMAHRSGLVREPPVGSYFDPAAPSLAEVVASLNNTELVYEPGTRTKYSNAAITVLGRILEKIAGRPFEAYIQEAVLAPLGMRSSAFARTPEIAENLARAWMWTYDGRTFPAPEFEYGIGPAANLYAPVTDLAAFVKMLFNDGKNAAGQPLLKSETLQAMWQVQFMPESSPEGWGLGFYVSRYRGHKRIGHVGAVHGFATELIALPELKLGVVAATTADVANAVLRRISLYAFDLMLALRNGQPLPEAEKTRPVEPWLAKKLDGKFATKNTLIELEEDYGRLFLWSGTQRNELRLYEDTLIVDDRLGWQPKIYVRDENLINIEGHMYRRFPDRRPPQIKEEFRGLIGEYGWDHNTLYILEKRTHLYALIEWFYLYPLRRLEKDVYAFPDYGLYHGEKVIFHRDQEGRATEVIAAGIRFARRETGPEQGQTFTIVPQRPVEELRRMAMQAEPPKTKGLFTPELVDLATIDPTIKFDIRYAGTNNFMQTQFYRTPRAYMQRAAAEALGRVADRLRRMGFGLLVYDAYRPWYVTKMFWDATPDSLKHFVADPQKGSVHNRGAAVDLTLYDLKTGKPVEMVSGYDEFSPRAYPRYPGGTDRQRWYRKVLRRMMEAEGFHVYEWEWWHFNYRDAQQYPIMNVSFEDLQKEALKK